MAPAQVMPGDLLYVFAGSYLLSRYASRQSEQRPGGDWDDVTRVTLEP